MISFSPNLSALQAFGVGMHGTAYNIANVNTDGFQPVAVHYRSNAPADLGVHAVVTRPPADAQARPGQFAAGATGATPPQASPETPPAHSMEKAWAKVPQSNVELAREFTTMMITQRAFEANAVTIRSNDEMLGTVLDLKA